MLVFVKKIFSHPFAQNYKSELIFLTFFKDEFQDLLEKNTEKLIVVDFYATWCGPCKMISPKVEAMVSDYPDVVFAKVSVVSGLNIWIKPETDYFSDQKR